MFVDYNQIFNYYSCQTSSIFSSFSLTAHHDLKIVKVALGAFVTLVSLGYLFYLKMRQEKRLVQKTSSLKEQVDLPTWQQNSYLLKECSFKIIDQFLQQHPQVKDVYFEKSSKPIPTALLRQLLHKRFDVNTKTLSSAYQLKNSTGKMIDLCGFEKIMLMQNSSFFRDIWAKNVRENKVTSIDVSDSDFQMLRTLLQSLYDPLIVEEKKGEIHALARASCTFQLNKKFIKGQVEKLLIASFEESDIKSIEKLLYSLSLYQKPLIESIQQALQYWLNQSINTRDFSTRINLLKRYIPSLILSLDFS